ncbi:PAS domain-containing protein [Natrinema sp. 1APR25-10V2]|uniref:PAS domain-containing protein n=1 Tax=Natrinema sp. 1APR25-10V2 TaxID=2951081 RepID=UPI002874D575|nr:PAS domain-containing protein [Natrinema sp. 1APR25-10V2]MDS0473526.1 PAS domain-containing protein [Natrinema sp. 1APR25-10V2]
MFPTSEIHVLHVDDEPDFAEMAAEFLRREDDRFDVETATSVSKGLERLADAEFDCVVSDYDMPGQSGLEFLEAVRDDRPDLPFILFTGKGSEEVASDAISAGVTDYLQKESGTDQYTVLANRIANAVERERSRRLVERNERRLRELIDSLPHLLYVVDIDGTYLLANQALADFHDTTVTDIEGSNVADVLPDATAEEFRGHVADVLDEGAMKSFPDAEIPDSSGAIHIFNPRLLPYDFGETDEQAVLGIASDVTDQRERERELELKERRYQAIFNDPNILVGLLDTNGTVLDINQTAMNYVDVTLEDVTGEPFWKTPWFGHAETVQEQIRDWIDRAARGEYVEFDLDLVDPSGDPYAVEGVIRPVTNDADEVVSLIISDREVTDQRVYERELEEANAVQSTLLDTLPVGVLAEDASRNVVAVNAQLFELFDLPGEPDEITGADCSALAADASEMFAEPAAFVERIHELVTEGDPMHNEEVHLRDGQTFARSYQPIELPEGEGHLWVYRDITDSKRRETRLEALNTTTQDLMAAETRDDVAEIGVSAAAEILGMEASAIHLYDEQQSALVPQTITDAATELIGDPPKFTSGDSIAWRAYEVGEPLAVDDVHDDPDAYNPESPVQSELHLPLDGHGILMAGSDTTAAFDQQDLVFGELLAGNVAAALEQVNQTEQLRARERELMHQNDRLEAFASVVSHDLRNPLNVAEGRLELAREEYDSDDLDEVDRALGRMDVLIDDLLTLAREGDHVQELEPVDIGDLARQCWANVETKDATLDVTTEAKTRADRSRLKQVFENLFRNAVEHGGADVAVSVGGLAGGFYIEDDGPGIPPDKRETVFEPGYSITQEGTGFGLSIVKEIIDGHGWEIEITDGEAGGGRFEISGVASE